MGGDGGDGVEVTKEGGFVVGEEEGGVPLLRSGRRSRKGGVEPRRTKRERGERTWQQFRTCSSPSQTATSPMTNGTPSPSGGGIEK